MMDPLMIVRKFLDLSAGLALVPEANLSGMISMRKLREGERAVAILPADLRPLYVALCQVCAYLEIERNRLKDIRSKLGLSDHSAHNDMEWKEATTWKTQGSLEQIFWQEAILGVPEIRVHNASREICRDWQLVLTIQRRSASGL